MSELSDAKKRIAELEAELETKETRGRIFPTVGKSKGQIVLHGVNAAPMNTINLYASQYARLLRDIPAINKAVLDSKFWKGMKANGGFRNDEEERKAKAFLTAYTETEGKE